MKPIFALLLISMTTAPLFGGAITRELRPFTRVIVSPHINVVMKKGDTESVRIEYEGVRLQEINFEVEGKTLRVYLNDAKGNNHINRASSYSKYKNYESASVTAYITYTALDHIEIRGNQSLTCLSPIVAERFTLKSYGENEISLASVKTGFLKTRLYGQNTLTIQGGKAEYQQYKLYGENEIDATKLKSYSASTTCFGESKIDLNPQDELRVTSFGESRIAYAGSPTVSKGLIFGQTRIHRALE